MDFVSGENEQFPLQPAGNALLKPHEYSRLIKEIVTKQPTFSPVFMTASFVVHVTQAQWYFY